MSKSDTDSTTPRRNFYGRLKGKTLNARQRQDFDEVLPDFLLDGVSREDNPERAMLDVDAIAQGKPLWLEVGFGSGEHLVHQAKSNPDVQFIGCEIYVNGVASLLGKIRREGMSNIAIHPGDARDLLDVLPANSLDKMFLLYPDPWPKARHHRRRFVTPEHLDPLAEKLKSGHEFRVATDIEDYVRQTLGEVPRAGFKLTENPADLGRPWDDWFSTRYEQKALREGRSPHYMTFIRD
ncbi:tRNA (guanine-N(7)-)-methyltransferase [Litoreibacter halocynthiae]|uniref:tRNA (guanine-N(7)-)-methyltransferase n=1 Tax=Litoreibacter halocynthiae TaxID=1242689 RepID=A0A4R7LG92_9RHOB|nr:tRNA (guanosine(46)-N7)-methyltransferase TrmB [Litoreibacter halocynthiae]TDT74219.1 tRNA (guanine-N(7)-)-methyltransferase [Litoreibacter halocynthiae]